MFFGIAKPPLFVTNFGIATQVGQLISLSMSSEFWGFESRNLMIFYINFKAECSGKVSSL